MAETLPMLEKDPRSAYKPSRGLRILAFSFFASVVLVSLFIVAFRFLWDNYVTDFFNGTPYNTNPLLILGAIGLITAVLGKILWDTAEERQPKRRGTKR